MNSGSLRVGIDVGGTFTDVVAIDAATREIVARIKVPTTHDSADGVAAGIVAGLQRLLDEPRVDARRIAFIAHSTTQATNALLEGDVARVGLIAVGTARNPLARLQLRVPPVRLTPEIVLQPVVARANGDDESIRAALERLIAAGVEVVAASEAFGVDRPGREARTVQLARDRGLPATAGHDVATSYGLRARTRTALVNAAILPTMLRTARMTADAVARAGIAVPLMIMRSDGGVMDVHEVERRPILTMLSGPAAGIAGALLHENVTDGIFIEVGGTSADCSVIRRGMPQLRAARIGGHRTMLRTLDVRTVAIAGGSLANVDRAAHGAAAIRDVGPRSAHIAGYGYACFTRSPALEAAEVVDGGQLTLRLRAGTNVALTPTCAANLLGYVPPDAFARGDAAATQRAFEIAAAHFGCRPAELARAILEHSATRLRATIDELVGDYELDVRSVELVGGGGGAAALVPYLAERMGIAHRLARDAEVISPIGVALALVRDVVERTIPNPSPGDVLRVRREAIERVIASGAAPELVQVTVEIDARRNLVRATAQGGTAAVAGAAERVAVDRAQRLAAVARATHAAIADVTAIADLGELELCAVERHRPPRRWFETPRAAERDLAVVDRSGVVRLVVGRGGAQCGTVARIPELLSDLLDEQTVFGDVGRALPTIAVVYGTRVVDLGSLAEANQVIALAEEELRGLDPSSSIAVIASRREI